MPSLKVIYVLLYFPYLTETFIAEEIYAVRSQGIDVQIISLLRPRSGPVQPRSQELLPYTWYAPIMLAPSLWIAQIHFLLKSPGIYLSLLIQLLRQPYPKEPLAFLVKRLVIFLKAVAVARYLEGNDVQSVHTHFAWLSGAAARIISKLLDLPFTVTVHAYDIFSTENDLLCFTASSAIRVIAISDFNKQAVLDICPDVKESAISVIHCGVDLEQFCPPVREDGKPLSILSVGSLLAKKGHKYLIQACQRLKADGIDFRCTIIGGGPDEETLRQLVRGCDLESLVTLRGPCKQPEVLNAYREHSLFVLACTVLPSGARDGIPVVLMEAMAMEMPVISTPVSGIPELVRHGETGWLVPERDAAAIAEAITRLAADKPLRERLGRAGRAHVEQEFQIRDNAVQLATLFRRVGVEQEESSKWS